MIDFNADGSGFAVQESWMKLIVQPMMGILEMR